MKIMHPLRHRMIDVILEMLPFRPAEALTVVDLGAGTGLLTGSLLNCFPNSTVLAVDGAPTMIAPCREHLGSLSDRVRFLTADFRSLSNDVIPTESVDAIVSSYALHHLSQVEKRNVLSEVFGFLRPGGWFINADLVVASSPSLERRIQRLRVEGILRRAPSGDPRFLDFDCTANFLANLEAEENDQPLTLDEDVLLLREAGFESVEIFWKEHREVVVGGLKRE